MSVSENASHKAHANSAHENRLAQETSPYLLQHKHNPVDWWAWGPRRLGGGQRQQQADPAVGRLRRLPLVPCHGAREFRGRRHRGGDERAVRQHQGRSRRAPGHRSDLHVGAAPPRRAWRLAADHVPDARRRAVLGRHLFPQGKPLRPRRLCRRVAPRRAHLPGRPQKHRTQQQRLDGALAETARPKDRVVIGPAELDRAAHQLAGAIDPVNGGVRGAPKFPNSMMLEFLWRAGQRSRVPSPARGEGNSIPPRARGGRGSAISRWSN